MVNNQVILAGAIPAAAMALLADLSLGWLEKRLSRGITVLSAFTYSKSIDNSSGVRAGAAEARS